MTEVPALSREDVREQLELLCARERQGRHLFAFYGRGAEDTIEVNGAGRFYVRPVRSELDLRANMPPLEEEDPRIAFLVPWATEIPIDLAGRFSRNGKIMRIGREARLKRLFGAAELDGGVLESPLADYLLSSPPAQGYATTSGVLTLGSLWSAWLRQEWGIEARGGLGLDALVGWAALDQRGSEFLRQMEGHPDVRESLLGHLKSTVGDAGPVVWKAWERGAGRRVLEWAVLFEVLVERAELGEAMRSTVRTWLKTTASTDLGIEPSAVEPIGEQLARAASVALRSVAQKTDKGFIRSVLSGAEHRVTLPEIEELLIHSPRLPAGWMLRLGALGRALRKGVSQESGPPTVDAVKAAVTALRSIEGHSRFTDPEETRTVQRAEMAVRLLSWLAARPQDALEPGRTPYADVENLGRWYAEEGGYVDWARELARGTSEDDFGRGVQAVVEAADGERRNLDRRFAKGLQGWVQAKRPASQVVPIDQAVKRIAARFLEQEPSRKLLVLLIDGMAWAQAVEILDSLGSRAWGPIAWHASKDGRIGEGAYPVMLANFPTVTEVSRAAFFAGKPMTSGARLSTSDDPKWWMEHRDVSKLFEPPKYPRLLLRAEGHTSDGSASREALSLVGDSTQRVVALVINAIDASLKGDTQQRHSWTVDSIESLPDLLDKAREAGRAVLLAADHGHVPADLLTTKGTYAGAGARWRPWKEPSDPVEEYEVALHGDGVYAPKGAHGVILLSDDQSRYGGAAHAGEHGGATLAEVVAPCLLIAPDYELASEEDPGLRVRPAYVPPWWHFDVAGYIEVPVPEPAKKQKAPEKPQMELDVTPPAKPRRRRPTPSSLPARPSALEDNDVLAARATSVARRRQVITAVELLRDRDFVMSASAFAAGLGEPTWRVGQVVSVLQEALNVEGYQVLEYDRTGQQIRLHREMLETQFGVKL